MSKPKSYVTNFKIVIGPIASTGALVKLDKTAKSSFSTVCPDCTDEPRKPRQVYVCDTCESQHTVGELRKATLVDDELRFINKAAITEAKKSDLQLNTLRLTVHPAAEAWQQTFSAGGNAYVFVPSDPDESYSTLVALVEDGSKTFLGVCNLRHNEGLFRLLTWRDQLIVQKIAWPDEIDELEPAPLNVDDEILQFAREFVDRITVPFDASFYKNTIKDKLAAMNASLAETDGTPVPVQAAAPKPKQSDLLMLLKASVGK